jgi:hypothetical protein
MSRIDDVINFFKENEVEIPKDVKDIIEDCFYNHLDIEEVEIYGGSELENFEDDLQLFRTVTINANHNTTVLNYPITNTYYGEVSFNVNDLVIFEHDVKGSFKEETIIDEQSLEPSHVEDPKDWVVLVIEFKTYNNQLEDDNLVSSRSILYIYTPEELKEVINEEFE